MRRADLLLEMLRAEGSRRDKVRDAILAQFDVTGDRRFALRRRHVHEAVRLAMGVDTMPPSLRKLSSEVTRQLGAILTTVSNRRLFRGVKRRGISDAAALQESRRELTRSESAGKDVNNVKDVNPTQLTNETIEAQLAGEGMPAELGGARTIDPVRLEMARARDVKVARAQQILKLCQSGKSVRVIAQELGMDKSAVHRVLLRLHAVRGVPGSVNARKAGRYPA